MTTMDKAFKGTKNQIGKLIYTLDESDEFIQKLKATDDISNIASFLLLINLGLRKSELLALQWQDINLQNKTIRIHQTIDSGELNKPYIKVTKNHYKRTLDIDDKTLQALFKWQELQAEQLKLQNIEHQGDKQFIFLNNKNTFYINSNLNSWLKKFQTQYGLACFSSRLPSHLCYSHVLPNKRC